MSTSRTPGGPDSPALTHRASPSTGRAARRLATRLNITTGSASRLVERLVAAGHVRRVADPDDRRRVLVEPEPASLARVGALYDPLNARLAAELADADDTVLERMAAFLAAAEQRTEDVIREL